MTKLRWLFLAGVILVARPAQAADWSVEAFSSQIEIQSDASIKVVERIQANFAVPKHGIFRNIPWHYQDDQGNTVTVPIDVQSVTNDAGQAVPFDTSTQGDVVDIKIGDPDVTVTGPQTYLITYVAGAAVNFLSDHDELYWNVTGDDWEVPITNVDVAVRMSTGYSVQAKDLQATCYTGSLGSRAQDCTTTIGDSMASFHGNDFTTVVVGWPKDVIMKPANYDQLRSSGTVDGFSLPSWALWVFNLGLPIVTLIWVVRRWQTHGRDPKGKRTIIAQYDPPPGLTPGEMGTLFDEHANHRDIVATIVDLAVRGYLTITEIAIDKLIGKSKDYQLTKTTSKESATLKAHEKRLYDGLFSSGAEVTLSKLKGTLSAVIKEVQTDLYQRVRDEGLFAANPNSVRLTFGIGGVVIIVLGFFLAGLGIFGVIAAGLVIAVASPFMPQRTNRGVEAFWHAKGFKLFLEKAEKYRLQWQEKEHIFEQYLPYAMAFGVAEKWSKTFEGVQKESPSWYHGSNTFNSIMLWSALNDFSSTTVRSFAPPAASGSSGFGGGGFSGGGFGGGGGGSW